MIKGNNWITTKSGGQFDFANPKPWMLNIKDIAGALSKICRFGGHGRKFYSVAEHCLNVAHCTEVLGGHGLAGLLHDAQEAYCGDCVTPLKRLLPGYQDIEAKIVQCIADKWLVNIHHHTVVHSDAIMLWAEALILVPGVKKWPKYPTRPRLPHPNLAPRVRPLTPQEAERKFLRYFKKHEFKH